MRYMLNEIDDISYTDFRRGLMMFMEENDVIPSSIRLNFKTFERIWDIMPLDICAGKPPSRDGIVFGIDGTLKDGEMLMELR